MACPPANKCTHRCNQTRTETHQQKPCFIMWRGSVYLRLSVHTSPGLCLSELNNPNKDGDWKLLFAQQMFLWVFKDSKILAQILFLFFYVGLFYFYFLSKHFVNSVFKRYYINKIIIILLLVYSNTHMGFYLSAAEYMFVFIFVHAVFHSPSSWHMPLYFTMFSW